MSLNVSGTLRLTSSFTEVISIGLGSANVNEGISISQAYGNGTGANNIQEKWSKTSTPAANTPDTWTLQSLADSLPGGGTRTISLNKVRTLIISNLDTVDGHTLTVTAGAANPVGWLPPSTAQGIVIPAGGCLVLAAPLATALAVTPTADTIEINPGANAGNYSIEITGE